MPTELETQAAEAKCPIKQDGWDDLGGTHPPVCQCAEPGKAYGTGLRYPTLSKVRGHYDGGGRWRDEGRVPDVNLEKVFLLGGNWSVDELGPDDWGCTYQPRWEGYPEPTPNPQYGIGTTPQEAALAALLSSETPATPARKPPTPE